LCYCLARNRGIQVNIVLIIADGFGPQISACGDPHAMAPDAPNPVVARAYARVEAPPRRELFDVRADPYSIRNLADDPAYARKLRELNDAIARWRERTNDPFLSETFRQAFRERVARLKKQAQSGGH